VAAESEMEMDEAEFPEIYRKIAMLGASRLVSLLDRRPWSPTYGCLDREYWHYKTLIEFPRAVYQQGVLSLALLHRYPFEGNVFFGRPEVFDWVRASIRFWATSQNRDGSSNEWYLHERSFCATAFTAWAISESLLLLRESGEEEFVSEALPPFLRATSWLESRSNPLVANQMAASLAALCNAFLLTNDPLRRQSYEKRKCEVLGMQREEGWFSEYLGADIGYSFLILDLLGHVGKRMADDALKRSLERLLVFLGYFIHPDGTAGGVYGNRGTSHCFPYGMELLAAIGNPTARWMAGRLRRAVAEGRVATPLTVDDQYMAYFYLNSFTLAAALGDGRATGGGGPSLGPWIVHRNRYFDEAGILVRESGDSYAVVNAKKGGVWRAHGKEMKVHGDAGYVMVLQDGRCLSSQRLGPDATVRFKEEGDGSCELSIETPFCELDMSLPLVKWVVPFKIFSKWILRLTIFASLFGIVLKKVKIMRRNDSEVELKRRFRFGDGVMEIQDTIHSSQPIRIRDLMLNPGLPVVHSPSSQLFESVIGLTPQVSRDWDPRAAVKELEGGQFGMIRRIPFAS